ncbi:hypothetical protein B566_EDAN012528 [Ephemera danica]|nr:hypothetical protein B566_EDAN012528 [Ephemera danica]
MLETAFAQVYILVLGQGKRNVKGSSLGPAQDGLDRDNKLLAGRENNLIGGVGGGEGGLDDGGACSVGSHSRGSGIGSHSGGVGGAVSESIVGDAHVRLAHGGERGVEGLGVGGHLLGVAEVAVGVLADGGDSGSGVATETSHSGSGIGQRSCNASHRGGVGEGRSNTGSNSDSSTFLAHNSVESVDGVSGVVNNATSSVSLHEGVRSLDNISVAALTLFLVVSGQSISDGVGVRVLRVGVVVSVDGNSSLGDQWGSGVGGHSGGSSVAQRRDDSSAGNSHEGGENDEL